jgi:hypothetical protein
MRGTAQRAAVARAALRAPAVGSALRALVGRIALRALVGGTVLRAQVAAAALAAAAGARAEIVELAFDAHGHFAHAAPVSPGKFVEVCGKLTSGRAVAWRYQADAPLDFNIHYHQGKKVVMPEKRDATAAAQGTLKVARTEDYCWMWTNKSGSPAKLEVNLGQ